MQRIPLAGNPMKSEAQLIANGDAVPLHDVPAPAAGASAAPYRWAGLAPHRLKRVLACIDLRLAEPIQVCELAGEVHMSPFHFTRMFKLATGHSPHKFITLKRVERAKELLATSDMPISAIAAAVGYQTQAHFTGVFSRHAGTTPKVFRIAQRHADPAPIAGN